MMQNTDNKNQFYITEDVDAYTDNVDNLMDDLFGDVENILHVNQSKQRSLKQKNLNSQTSQNKTSAPYAAVNSSSSDMVALSRLDPAEREIPTSQDTVNITKLNVADISLPPISKEDVLWIQPYIMRNPEATSNFPPIAPEPVFSRYNLTDRLLLVLACSSALIAAILWTINHGIWLGRQSVTTAQVSTQVTPDNKAFGEEIHRMLAEVANKNRAIATNPNSASNIALMTAPILSTMPLPNSGNNPLGMQQPMYVPVYQPPTMNGNGSNNLPSPLALPPATANNTIDVSNSAATSRQNPISNQNQSFSSPVAAAPSYTLIGVLDLGERSTAMFDMNGSVQSIGLGKAVSNTGWYVSRISQQEITIKRGKETKTVFVGQKF